MVLYEDTTVVEKFLPSTNQVSTTALILGSPGCCNTIIVKSNKPIIKKTVDTVKKKLGKKPYRPSRDEIKSNHRQSKGLSPLNFEKMKKKG